VVTGETNGPTTAHAGRKRRSKCLRIAWRCSWATLPRGLKYGGLALQVRSWATGRQSLTVKKRELRPWRLSGIDLGTGKGLMR